MTKTEIKTAFEMRCEGKSWAEIGDALKYDPSVVRKAVRKATGRRSKENRHVSRTVE